MREGRDVMTRKGDDAEKNQLDHKIANPSSSQRILTPTRPEAWNLITSEMVADCRVFQVKRDLKLNPRGGSEHAFYRLEAPDWINIIPLTGANEVVMVEQYRHGTGEVTLEVPGGMVDEGESPAAAAARELLEESGYHAPEVIALGKVRPNPAIQQNWIHFFLARNVSYQHEPEFDGTEHTVVRLVPLADVPALIADGSINHALVVVAFYRLWLYQQNYRLRA